MTNYVSCFKRISLAVSSKNSEGLEEILNSCFNPYEKIMHLNYSGDSADGKKNRFGIKFKDEILVLVDEIKAIVW